MSVSFLGPEVIDDLKELISSLTNFSEDEENFGLCFDYAVSNLLYHNCLDPEEKKVSKCFRGLAEKLEIHAEREKKTALEDLLKRYDSCDAFKEDHPQYDIKIRLLSLLWHLSDSPLNSKWTPQSLTLSHQRVEQRSNDVNWHELLAQDEETCLPGTHGYDSDLSPWSSDDEESVKASLEAFRKLHQNSTLSSTEPSSPEVIIQELKDAMQPNFWADENRVIPKVDSASLEAHFVTKVDILYKESGLNPTIKEKVTEYQLLRECLWLLQSPGPSKAFLFDKTKSKFILKRNICLPSVTCQTLESFMKPFCELLSQIKTLVDFVKLIFDEQKSFESSIPFTYEAYACALTQVLNDFSAHVIQIERTVSSQEDIFTLMDLQNQLEDWTDDIGFIFQIHLQIVNKSKEASNWQKAIKTIAVLSKWVMCAAQERRLNIALELFLKSCKPYFRISSIWLDEGRFEDFRDEYFCSKVEAEGNETFWTESISMRPIQEYLSEQGLQVPQMFASVFPKILIAGKSIDILTNLEKKGIISKPFQDLGPVPDVFDTFIQDLKAQAFFCDDNRKESIDAKEPEEIDPAISLDFDASVDPYLVLAFKEALKIPKAENATVQDPPCLQRKVDLLAPLEKAFENCLVPIIQDKCSVISRSLLLLITGSLHFETHLKSVRRVFLMEAGDIVHEFYSDFFERLLVDKESIDSTSLTLFLQDCIARRYPGDADRFILTLPDDELGDLEPNAIIERLIMNYTVDWPLNIILSSDCLHIYNQVFRFLLQVKRALWTLQKIRHKSLQESLASSSASAEDSSEIEDSKVCLEEIDGLTDSEAIHRILLLRSWLMHFVGNVHSYFMTRVLHSTELELTHDLRKCENLDEIIEVHRRYLHRIHDRCFFHGSAKVLREAVLKVLKICHGLYGLCQGDIKEVTNDRLVKLEKSYVRSHEFLGNTLHSMSQRLNVPHLDGLAAALIHSMPSSS